MPPTPGPEHLDLWIGLGLVGWSGLMVGRVNSSWSILRPLGAILGPTWRPFRGPGANLGLRGRPRYPVCFLFLRGFAHAAGLGLGPDLDWAILGHFGDDHFEPS